MSERLIDSVCPHCGRLGTTVRVVKHEDGYTKLSRRCTDCGGEWIHTFDADWLAVANRRRLEAEVERLRAEIERLRADRRERIATAVMAGLAACPNTRSSAEGVARSGLDGADALIALLDQEGKP